MLCIHVYQIINLGPCLYNTACHTDKLYFLGFSVTLNQREAQMFHGTEEVENVYYVLPRKR